MVSEMEPINAFDMYVFYQQKKRPNVKQSEIIKCILQNRFYIPFHDLDRNARKSCETEIECLLNRLKRILKDVRGTKKMESLRDKEFVDLNKFPALLKLSKLHEVQNVSPSAERGNSVYDQEGLDGQTSTGIPHHGQSTLENTRKRFGDLQSQTQRHLRIEDTIIALEDLAKKEGLSLASLLGYIGYSRYYNNNRKLALLFQNIWQENDPDSLKEIPIETAIYLKEKNMISQKHYTDFRLTLKQYAVFPTYNSVSSYIHSTMPALRSLNEGVIANVLDVAILTLSRLPEKAVSFLENVNEQRRKPKFVANFTTGLDGSGSHKIYNSASFLSSTKNTSNLIIAGMALNSICIDDETKTLIHSVDNACSFNNQRPIAIVPGRETRENIQDVLGSLDIGMFQGQTNDHTINFGTFTAAFRINIIMSQVDTKMIKMISGLTGAYCTSCTISESDAHSIPNITRGFKIDRSIDKMKSLYDEISLIDEHGVEFVPKTKKDYERRKGLCMKPITKADVCSNITVLHSYLNALSFFERLMYCLNAGVLKMSSTFRNVRYSKDENKRISDAKQRLQLRARSAPLFTQLDTPSSGGTAGTSDTGNVARMFFSQDKRNEVIELVEGNSEMSNDHRSKVKDLLQRFSIILRVLSSKSVLISYSQFDKYCKDTNLQLVNHFNWVHIPGSIHRLLSHCAERIHLNSDYGLGNQSEEGLESCNKMVRRFRELGTRRMGLKECITDVYTHWWIQSDGKIQACARPNQCRNCWKTNPTTFPGPLGNNISKDISRVDFIGNDDNWIFESLLVVL